MASFVAFVLSVCGLIAVVFAAPTTYDQRQDGGVNIATKLENILIVLAIPSNSSPVDADVDASDLAPYLNILGARDQASSTQLDVDSGNKNPESNEPSKDDRPSHGHEDEEIAELSSAEDGLGGPVKQEPKKATPEKSALRVRSKGGRNLWSQIEEVEDNTGKGTSSKKELSWGQDVDPVAPSRGDQHRSNDHNEVGLIPHLHLTLLGTGIEDCGPYRQRNSYGICQPALPTK